MRNSFALQDREAREVKVERQMKNVQKRTVWIYDFSILLLLDTLSTIVKRNPRKPQDYKSILEIKEFT